MKVLIFSYLFPNPKLPNRGIFNLSRAKALKREGCEVIVVAPVSVNPNIAGLFSFAGIKEQITLLKKLNSIPEVEEYEEIKVYHPKWVTAPRKMFWKYLSVIMHFFIGKKLDKIISGFKPDLIISTWLNPFSVYGKYFKKYSGLKHFALAEGSDVLLHPQNYRGWNKIEKTINKNSDIVLAVSQKMKNQIKISTNLQRVKVIQNGYDENIFSFDKNTSKNNSKYFRIISVANLNVEKGHDILLDALQQINFPYKLTLAGDGPLITKYKKIVKNRNLENKVEFLGQVPHNKIQELLTNQDLFCLPSRSEGFPSAPLEAMACGLPVVASNVGGMNEIIINGFNGFLCRPESKEELAEKIIKASKITWDNKEISEWVMNNFGWSTWAAKIINTYLNLNIENTPEMISNVSL